MANPTCVRTKKEVDEQLDRAFTSIENGGKYPGMSYEEGVKYAIEWLLGDSEEKPMED